MEYFHYHLVQIQNKLQVKLFPLSKGSGNNYDKFEQKLFEVISLVPIKF